MNAGIQYWCSMGRIDIKDLERGIWAGSSSCWFYGHQWTEWTGIVLKQFEVCFIFAIYFLVPGTGDWKCSNCWFRAPFLCPMVGFFLELIRGISDRWVILTRWLIDCKCKSIEVWFVVELLWKHRWFNNYGAHLAPKPAIWTELVSKIGLFWHFGWSMIDINRLRFDL